jgi:uncharacterized protein (TIGR02217 family)
MAFWLARKREGQETDFIQRFDPRFWTVDFPRPMMASVVTTAADALRVDLEFQRKGDLAGLIWASEDTLDHPLLAYDTDRDYSRTTLRFHWRSSGVIALDAVDGPTLTIEGRDAAGASRSWFVRLWNYATGTPEDAHVELAFSSLAGGWDATDPVYPADIDRMFVSLTPPGYIAEDTTLLASRVDAWVELTGMVCEGHRPMLTIGDVLVPPHGVQMAMGYDDAYNQSPARVLRSITGLGYRGRIVHYVGMSHFFRLVPNGSDLLADAAGTLCGPAEAWHANFFAGCQSLGFAPIVSLSYELLVDHCPDAWQQRDFEGNPARTGWVPPSALLSPANEEAMAWLQAAAANFVRLQKAAGLEVLFQVGEPWWWTTSDGRICLYDDAAKAAFGGDPVTIEDIRGALSQNQLDLLDQAGTLLSHSTSALAEAVRQATAPAPAEILLLTFTPTLLAPDMPELARANMPLEWAAPAFDRLQVEDYDWLTTGAEALRKAAYRAVDQRLRYSPAQQDYLAGFVLAPENGDAFWPLIDGGLDEAAERGVAQRFVWALPQVCRDGFTRLPDIEDDTMQSFDDVSYPLALGRDATVSPEFSTSVSVTASGYERRSSQWTDARLRYDVGPGIRSDAELGTLIGFFRARRGAARGFRLADPFDFSSNGMTGTPTMLDQLIAVGDGLTASFRLVKSYGDPADPQVRPISRPREGTVVVSIDGVATTGFTLGTGGWIAFESAPPEGAAIRAGFLFDVPVRFAEDRLDISGAAFAAGEAPSVPLVEVREAA